MIARALVIMVREEQPMQSVQRWPLPRDALEGKGPQRPPRRRLDRRLEEVAEAAGGGYCRLQVPLRLAFALMETVVGHTTPPPPQIGCRFPRFAPILRLDLLDS